MIIIEPCAGLGNRFLALSSAYYWAKDLNEELVVLWKSETALGADCDLLFHIPDDIKIVKAKDFGMKKNPFGAIRYKNLVKKYKARADLFLDVEDVKPLYDDREAFEKAMRENKVKYIRSLVKFYDLEDMKAPFAYIEPSERVLERVKETIPNVDASKNVGVHIRRTDNAVSICNSPLEIFVKAMQDEISADPETTFYVASDDEATVKELCDKFGDKVFIMKNKSFSRENEAGIIDAYAELLCLSHSKKILGSYYSSYSKIAAMLSDIPLEIVKNDLDVWPEGFNPTTL